MPIEWLKYCLYCWKNKKNAFKLKTIFSHVSISALLKKENMIIVLQFTANTKKVSKQQVRQGACSVNSQEYSTCLIALILQLECSVLSFYLFSFFLSIRILLSWEQKKYRKRFPDNTSHSELVFYILADGYLRIHLNIRCRL